MDSVVICVLLYVVAQLGIGFWVSRQVKTEADFLVAGRSLGLAMSTFTVFATWFGAETCVGSAGEAYRAGLSATTSDPFGYAICLFLLGLVFAIPLYRRKLFTLADLFRERYGANVERFAVLFMVPTSVMWAAAQIRAFGHVLGATSSWGIELTVTIAAIVVIVYTTMGGLLADAYTDFVQGIVLIVGLGILLVALFVAGDATAIETLPAEYLSPREPAETLLGTIEKWAIPIFGSVTAQELIARVVAAKSPTIARKACLYGGGLYLVIGVIPVVVGLSAAGMVPGAHDPEQILIVRASHYLPTVLYVIFAGALVSAILSTVNSALLVSGSLVAHNVVLRLWDAKPREKLLVNRAATVAFGVVAYGLALGAESVYALVEEASALGSSGIFVVLVFGLFTRIGGAASAATALVLGLAVYAVGSYLELLAHPYVASLAAAFIGYIAVASVETRLAAPAEPGG